jgi:hypothetical protein
MAAAARRLHVREQDTLYCHDLRDAKRSASVVHD